MVSIFKIDTFKVKIDTFKIKIEKYPEKEKKCPGCYTREFGSAQFAHVTA